MFVFFCFGTFVCLLFIIFDPTSHSILTCFHLFQCQIGDFNPPFMLFFLFCFVCLLTSPPNSHSESVHMIFFLDKSAFKIYMFSIILWVFGNWD